MSSRTTCRQRAADLPPADGDAVGSDTTRAPPTGDDERSAAAGKGASRPGAAVTTTKRVQGSKQRRSRLVTGAVVAVAVVAVAGLLVAGRDSSDGGGSGEESSLVAPGSVHLATGGDLLVLPDEPGRPPEVVMLAKVTGKKARVVTRVSLDGDVVWQAPVVEKDGQWAQFELFGDVILANLDDRVVALDVDTGAERWRADLGGVVSAGCEKCFAPVGDDRVMAFTVERELSVLSVASGESLWETTAETEADVSGSRALEDRVLVLDDDRILLTDQASDDDPVTVSVLDSATGDAISSFAPSCSDDSTDGELEPDIASPLTAVPGTDDVVLAYGSEPLCVQRWDPASGEVQWSTVKDITLRDPIPAAVSDTEMAFRGEGEVLLVGLADGRLEPVPLGSTTEPTGPMTMVGGQAVAAVQTRNGVAGWLVHGFAPGASEPLWTHELSERTLPAILHPAWSGITISPGTSTFALAAADDHLTVVTIAADGQEVTTERIDPGSGEATTVGTTTFRTGFPATDSQVRVEDVSADRVIFTIDETVQALDLTTGEVTSYYPR